MRDQYGLHGQILAKLHSTFNWEILAEWNFCCIFILRVFRTILWHFNFMVKPKYYISQHFNFAVWPKYYNLQHFSFAVALKIEFFYMLEFWTSQEFPKSMEPKCKLKYIFILFYTPPFWFKNIVIIIWV